MRRILVVAVAVCSLMWAVAGVSVLVIAYHEHHHHHAETHNHDDVFELVLHCHDNGGSHHHDYELTAPLSASRTSWSGHLLSMVTQANDLVDAEIWSDLASTRGLSEPGDNGPPAFLLHCVLLT